MVAGMVAGMRAMAGITVDGSVVGVGFPAETRLFMFISVTTGGGEGEGVKKTTFRKRLFVIGGNRGVNKMAFTGERRVASMMFALI